MHTCTHAHSFNDIFHYGLSWIPSLTHKRKAGSHGPDCLSPKPGFQHPSATKRISARIRFCKGDDSLWGKTAETAHLSDQSPVSCKGFRKFETTQNASDNIGSPKSTFTGRPGINDFIVCWGNMLKRRKSIISQLQGLRKPLTFLGTQVPSPSTNHKSCSTSKGCRVQYIWDALAAPAPSWRFTVHNNRSEKLQNKEVHC